MEDELQLAEAAYTAHNECLSNDEHRKSPYWLPTTECWSERRLEHAHRLACAYLAEHLPDDGEPLTKEWLRELKWQEFDGIFKWSGLHLTYWDKSGWRVQVGGTDNMWEWLGDDPTRGQVRQLCKALRIDIS